VVDALVSPDLAPIVDLVAWPEGDAADPEQTVVVVAHADGRCRLTPDGTELLGGRDPVAHQDPRSFLPYPAEVADPSPPNERNAYPLARERLARVFAHPTRSPDLVVVHAPRHYFPETGGHPGEHGSLDVIQSRAPLLVSGAGLPARGVIEGWARVVDVAPTLAALAGVPSEQHHDRAGRRLDGRVVEALVPANAPRPRWVVGTLWDGAHCGELLAMAAAGELPGVARLLERGTALDGGALAEFPSVTLANHTSLLTGVGVHRHGILGNMYRDRAQDRTVNTNTGSAWHLADEWTSSDVASVFDLVAAARPGATTVSVNEPTDRGATTSTMQLIRASGSQRGADDLGHLLPDPAASPFVESAAVLDDPYYARCTQVDDMGLQQVLQAWQSPATAPALTWWSATVTDAGHHAGGPRSAPARQSLREADRRLQALLQHFDALGVTDEVAVLLTADHGFEGSDPACRGSWSQALAATGVALHDVGSGFVYLDG
jgi:predicted AlkP superfamily pyrophosphatase or phosphodiesterase